jgi:hypothetical protein
MENTLNGETTSWFSAVAVLVSLVPTVACSNSSTEFACAMQVERTARNPARKTNLNRSNVFPTMEMMAVLNTF